MSSIRFLLALSLIASQPVLAQPAADPYAAAVAARRGGDPGRAVDLLRQVLVSQPANADAHLQLGLSLLTLERLAEAEAAFRRTIELAPNYADAHIGLARVAQRRGDHAAALAALEPVGPGNAEARQLRRSLGAPNPAAQPRLRVDLDFSYSDLDRPSRDWREASLRTRYQASERTALGAGVELSERFGRTDVYGEARLDRGIGEGSGVYLLAGGTPEADFRPRWQIGAGGFARLAGGPAATVLTLDGRQARYRSGDIQTLTPGIEQYILGGRAWLTARWINVFDERGKHQSGVLVRGDAMAGERLRFFAGFADAPDVSEGVVVDTLNIFGGLSYDASGRHTIRLSLGHEDRARGSDRLQLGLGVGTRF
jgi:YaiO family outer membrane protein